MRFSHSLSVEYRGGLFSRYRAVCSCGWQARIGMMTEAGAARRHAGHLLDLTGNRLDLLFTPAPERYVVSWEWKYDEHLWVPSELCYADPDAARALADLLDSLPPAIRKIRIYDRGLAHAS